MENPALDVAFTEVVDVDANTPRNDLRWDGLCVSEAGTIRSGEDTIQGAIHGPGHAEPGAVFERTSISRSFGAARQ